MSTADELAKLDALRKSGVLSLTRRMRSWSKPIYHQLILTENAIRTDTNGCKVTSSATVMTTTGRTLKVRAP
jgi:hypothetical protein